MKKLAIFTVAVLLVVAPRVALAAWWNPLSWFNHPQPREAPAPASDEDALVATSTVSTPTAIPEVSVNNSDSVIAKLRTQINTLNQDNTSLRNQIAAVEAKYQQCISQGTTTASNPDDEAAGKLRVELATLDKVDKDLEVKAQDGKEDLVKYLNGEKKLDGTPLFPVPPKSVTHTWDYQNLNLTTLDDLHTDVDDYRTILKIDLAQYEDVTN